MQFLLESFILTIFSVLIAIVLVELFPAGVQRAAQYQTGDQLIPALQNLLGFIGLITLTGLTAGSYPAFFLSSFNPVQALKKAVAFKNNFGLGLRQALVIIQFGFAIVLIVSTLILYQQLQHLKNRPLGYDTNALVEMPHEGNLYPKFDLFKDRILNSRAVAAVIQSSGSIAFQNSSQHWIRVEGMAEADKKVSFDLIQTTHDFPKTMNIRLIAGRDFAKGRVSDSTGIMLNETAVKRMGIKDPLGQQVLFNGKQRLVTGVFADVLWDEPTKNQHPMAIVFNAENSDVITMRLEQQQEHPGKPGSDHEDHQRDQP